MDVTAQLRQQLGAALRLAEPLAPYTTYRIGGPAQYFVAAPDEATALAALRLATELELPLFVLGGGSNILVSDAGFPGLVLHLDWHALKAEGNTVDVSSRVELAELLRFSLDSGLTGLECLAGIPGELGGAVRGNAGTFGQQIGDYVVHVVAGTPAGERILVPAGDCGFSYRRSAFRDNGLTVFGARIQLTTGDVDAGRALVAERLSRRAATQPAGLSAGCVFKNFSFDQLNLDGLRRRGLDVDRFAQFRKLPAAYVLERAGLKGVRVGQVEVSPVHANFLINRGGGSAAEVIQLIHAVREGVRQAFGLELEKEVQLVGFGDKADE